MTYFFYFIAKTLYRKYILWFYQIFLLSLFHIIYFIWLITFSIFHWLKFSMHSISLEKKHFFWLHPSFIKCTATLSEFRKNMLSYSYILSWFWSHMVSFSKFVYETFSKLWRICQNFLKLFNFCGRWDMIV